MPNVQDKRQTWRTPLLSRGLARLDHRWVGVMTRDFSNAGSRLEVPAELAPSVGSAFKLFLFGPGLGATGSVRWVAADHGDTIAIGVRFEDVDYSTRVFDEPES